ncbi:phage tail protein [Massilia sp. Root351]|nr:phage tail protein [Massilia sp. Root351]
MFAGNFAPVGWMFCEGQQLPISENETLFQLIGTTYGGDGQSTFALPDLRGRVPMHQGTGSGLSSYTLAEVAGVETVTLSVSQMPQHRHAPVATSNRASPAYTGKTGVPASTGGVKVYGLAGGGTSAMRVDAAASSSVAGGSQPHNNMAPSLGLNYIISMFGIFPSPT